MKSVLKDVETEPSLQPVIDKTGYAQTAVLGDEARPDVRARGFWRDGQNAFFDVMITNADCKSNRSKTVPGVLRKAEGDKKRGYNRRIMLVEQGTFTPLIFTTDGAMGRECQKYHKQLAEKISTKNGDRYDEVMRYIKVKTSFLVLKGTLMCLRGSRTIKRNVEGGDDFSVCLQELGV